MYRVLVLDDAKEIQNLVGVTLRGRAQVDKAETIAQASSMLSSTEYDMFIVDLNLPDGNGLSFLSHIRSNEVWSHKPILILSANRTVEDRIAGYSLGADDYLTKPFDLRELKAIVEAKLKKLKTEGNVIKAWGSLRYDRSAGRVYRDCEMKEEVMLTPRELRIFAHLLDHKGIIVSREQLLNKFWSTDLDTSDRVVDSHIASLRKKLGPSGQYIRTVYGSGYILDEHGAVE
ncbi:MAG: response regulator transcription factor [Bdellovibrio sp.]